MNHSTRTLCGISLIGLFCLSGCSLFKNEASPAKQKSWSVTGWWKKDYQRPTSLAAIWSPDVLTIPGKPPTRGFGGRIYLYNAKAQAIPVDGELIIHGYRGTKRHGESEQVKADKTFGFTAEQLTGHFSPSELGASYSIWIPWDAADGFQEEVTLIPTFKGTDGSLVQGAAAKLFLPGRSNEDKRSLPVKAQSVSFQSAKIPTYTTVHSKPSGQAYGLQSGLKTTTIHVPDSTSLVRRKSFTLGGTAMRTDNRSLAQPRIDAATQTRKINALLGNPMNLPSLPSPDAESRTEGPLMQPLPPLPKKNGNSQGFPDPATPFVKPWSLQSSGVQPASFVK